MAWPESVINEHCFLRPRMKGFISQDKHNALAPSPNGRHCNPNEDYGDRRRLPFYNEIASDLL
jgi:hypothetical protein